MNLDRIATLLASGLGTSQVATIVGCSPARISQLQKDEQFQLLLQSKIAETKKTDVEEEALSNKYMAAEHLLLNQVMELAPMADMREVVGALRTVAERQERMKARTAIQAPVIQQQQMVVSISIPAHALKKPEVSINQLGEITAIEGRSLAPMQPSAVIGMFSKMGDTNGGNHEQSSSNTSTEESNLQAFQPTEQSFLTYAGK